MWVSRKIGREIDEGIFIATNVNAQWFLGGGIGFKSISFHKYKHV